MDDDIIINLERGEYVKRRASLMRTLEIPKLSDAVIALGPPLAQLVFEECDEALKENFGLTPPLNGAGDELWVSPSDLLIGKVVLKPPLTQKHVQALTHQGILTIGGDIEMKYWNEMEIEKERALAEQRKIMLDDFEDQLNAQLKLVELRERAACQQEMQRMTEEFEARLLEELDNLSSRLRDEFAELYKQQEVQLREEFAKTLKKEIEQTVQNLTREFLDELERQKNIITKNFKLGLQKAFTQKEYELRMQQVKYKDSIVELKHNLECKNLANMMYVLCMERRKCCEEKADIERHYETEIALLYDTIHVKSDEIKELSNEKHRLIMEVNLRETCLLEIIKQFQKFINFALRAAPTQAEFLLSVEKMMVFELTDAVLKSRFRDVTPHTDIILPWYNYGTKCPEMVDLEIMDHHDCLNEINPPIPQGVDLGPDDFLPAFNYGEKLYVREDFRNMISQGIRITKSSTLWSRDVEILMDTLQQSVSSTHSEEEEEETAEPSQAAFKSSKTQATTDSIHFKFHQDKTPTEASKTNISLTQKDDLRSSIRNVCESLERVDFSKIGKVEKTPAILAATCSVELLIKKGSLKYRPTKKLDDEASIDEHSDEYRESVDQPNVHKKIQAVPILKQSQESIRVYKRKGSAHSDHSTLQKWDEDEKRSPVPCTVVSKSSLVLEAKDSIILHKASLAIKPNEFNVLPNDSIEVRKDSLHEIKKKTSKLMSTRNSLEMLRESKMRLRESSIKCPRKVSKSKPTGSSCVIPKETCADRCLRMKDDSIEVIDGLGQELKQGRKDSIKVSHIEIFDVEGSIETNVAFKDTPIVYDTGSATYSTNLSQVYKYGDTYEAPKKKRRPPPKDKFLSQKPKLKVLGDREAIEYLQESDEFTLDRIKSFIALIKNNPQLIRTFTACTR